MTPEVSFSERALSVVLCIGCVVVIATTVVSLATLDTNEEIAAELRAAQEAADRGDIDEALDRLLTVISLEPNSVKALRGAACIAPEVGAGELVPLLLSDLLRAGWDWRTLGVGCRTDDLYLALFQALDVNGLRVVYRVPDVEDVTSRELESRARELANADDGAHPLPAAQVAALAGCINARHGLELMAIAQHRMAARLDQSAMSILSEPERCSPRRED